MKLLAMGDWHCGHIVGLTPPGWQVNRPTRGSAGAMSKKLWREFTKLMKGHEKPDYLILNGDLIDGRGEKSAGTELITTNRIEQCQMAAQIVSYINPGKVYMSYGTPYHTGSEDLEQVIADQVGAQSIKGHGFLDIKGLLFDYKHKIGSSGIPHGRANAVLKEKLWSDLWAVHDDAPRADVILRSHVHYHQYAGDSECLCMTLPALQGPGSKFGVRQCSGLVDFGFVSFDISNKGNYSWQSHVVKVTDRKAKIQYAK